MKIYINQYFGTKIKIGFEITENLRIELSCIKDSIAFWRKVNEIWWHMGFSSSAWSLRNKRMGKFHYFEYFEKKATIQHHIWKLKNENVKKDNN